MSKQEQWSEIDSLAKVFFKALIEAEINYTFVAQLAEAEEEECPHVGVSRVEFYPPSDLLKTLDLVFNSYLQPKENEEDSP